MNREELNRKAEEYALEKCKECYMCNSVENGERGYCPKYESRIEGYIAGATEATKELQEENKKLDTMLTGESLVSSERKDKLIKAKELLKTFMKISEENGRQFDEEVYFEAREFLKE